jgi:hypothetical protein
LGCHFAKVRKIARKQKSGQGARERDGTQITRICADFLFSLALSQKPKKGCRHCGLDPQSPDNKAVFFRRSRVKRGMTLF